MDKNQERELVIAIRRLIEGARAGNDWSSYVLVERVDFERLNRLAAELPCAG